MTPTQLSVAMATIDPDRYLVFNRAEHTAAVTAGIQPTELNDAVVIRKQDRFAYSALNAYAAAVITAQEILEEMDIHPSVDLDYLRSLADYFAEQANEALQFNSKLPD